MFVVLNQGPTTFGWRVIPPGVYGRSNPGLVPIDVKRIDRRWVLSRDHQPDRLATLSAKNVVVLGCGSLGSLVIELLARAGVGQIEVVDPDLLDPENVSRHTLGLSDVLLRKAASVCSRTAQKVPGAKLVACSKRASEWLATAEQIPDLVLDCTGERDVRLALSSLRTGGQFGFRRSPSPRPLRPDLLTGWIPPAKLACITQVTMIISTVCGERVLVDSATGERAKPLWFRIEIRVVLRGGIVVVTKIFVNLPVQDLNRSKEFFGKLGFTFNPQFTNEDTACMVISDDIYAMLLTRKRFKDFTRKEIADATRTTEVLTALALESRAKVDELTNAALAAGGTEAREPEDHGFMYGRSFNDPDGHIWEPFYMDPSAIQQS